MKTEISPEFEAKANEIIARYPVSKRSSVLMLLHLWQDKFGFVSDDGMEWIAQKLEMELINVLELVTFYPMFRQQAVGKIHIKVCRTLSCELAGAREIYDYFKKMTKATGKDDEVVTSPDGKYTVEFVECLACCNAAPAVMVNEDLYQQVDEDEAGEILKRYV